MKKIKRRKKTNIIPTGKTAPVAIDSIVVIISGLG
jgi:hypothetical protein